MTGLETLRWDGKTLELLDQNKLPGESTYVPIHTVEDTFGAIRDMTVRGAPAIGVAAAYGMVLAARALEPHNFLERYRETADYLNGARPTAVNLMWATARMVDKACDLTGKPWEETLRRLQEEAVAIHQEDLEANRAIGEHLLSLVRDGDAILTHCNAGSLATAGYGTALSVFYVALEKGIHLRAYADETRPRLQGAKLTCLELQKAGVDVTLICDNTAAVIMAQGKVNAVITGADRVAANGDSANKIGTYGVSVLARHHGIPFYIAAPTSTIDRSCAGGGEIPVEERSPEEVTRINGQEIAPRGIKVYSPAFDITPAHHIAAIVTEQGIARPPYEISLGQMAKANPK